jgi:hypothetical protein
MRIRQYSRLNGDDGQEVGWISLVDLFVVLLCLLILAVIVAVREVARSRDAQTAADSRVGLAVAARNRAFSEAAIWRVGANHWYERAMSLKAQVDPKGEVDKAIAASEGRSAEASQRAQKAEDRAKKYEESSRSLMTILERIARSLPQQGSTSPMGSDQAELNPEDFERVQGIIESLVSRANSEGQVKQDLLGLPGKVGNVVFVIDRSQSMAKDDRWESAQATVASWIEHLPVDRAAAVLFGSDVDVVPENSATAPGWAPDSRELPIADAALRRTLLDSLKSIAPSGLTRTHDGLRRAMDFRDIDAIILFTDGAPDSVEVTGFGDARQSVIDLVGQWRAGHPGGRVHVVGVCDYFKPGLGDFLLRVARAGDGAFIGR